MSATDLKSMLNDPSLLLIAGAATVFVLFARTMSIYPFLKALHNGNRVSLLTSMNLGNISEFSLVIAAIGMREGHIGSDILTILIFTSKGTTTQFEQ